MTFALAPRTGLGAKPPQFSSSLKRSLTPESPTPAKRPRDTSFLSTSTRADLLRQNISNGGLTFPALAALDEEEDTKDELSIPDDDEMFVDMPGLLPPRHAAWGDELDDEGDSSMGLVSTEEIVCSQGTILVPDTPPARPPPVIVSSSSNIPETSSPPFFVPERHALQPNSSVEAQRGTSPAQSPFDPFPTMRLGEAVDLENHQWRPYLQHAHVALQNLGYDGPKSLDQLRAMLLILRRRQNFIFLLPTGFGKSLLYQFIAKLSAGLKVDGHAIGGNTLVISPFVALLQDQVDKAHTLNIQVFNWSSRPSGSINVPSGTRLILIQPESFISKTFKEYVPPTSLLPSHSHFLCSWHRNWVLREGGAFNRVFVDEFHDAHEGVKDRVQHVWRMVVEGLRAVSAQVVLLTATMPPHLLHMYQQLLKRDDFNVIRESSDRPNLAYHFLPAYDPAVRPQYHYEDIAQELVVSLRRRIALSSRPRDRIIVFFPNLPSVNSFTDEHGYLLHFSSRTKDQLNETLSRWDSGECPVMVSTTAMAQGFDRSDVRYIIVADVYYGMTLLSQMIGRCGRDGLRGDLFFIGPPSQRLQVPAHWDTVSMDAQNILNSIPTCQRFYTMTHMDGVQFAYTCTSAPAHLQPVNPCGNCDPESELHQEGLIAVASAAQIHRRRGARLNLPATRAALASNSTGSTSTSTKSSFTSVSGGSETYTTSSTVNSSLAHEDAICISDDEQPTAPSVRVLLFPMDLSLTSF